MSPQGDFAAFILTNGRPNKVLTYEALREHGYSGPIFIVIDDLDKSREQYIEKYGSQVLVFDKKAIAEKFDTADNFDDMRAIVYARNACFDLAKQLGFKHFIQLDDDYFEFRFKFNEKLEYISRKLVPNLDRIFQALVTFHEASNASAVSLAQGGDFLGGRFSLDHQKVKLKRKCMNSFVCSTDRPFQFIGRVNEDVNTYTHYASKGALFFMTNQVALEQVQTQSSSGGMTELYLDSGTYVKSFYSVMFQPSSVVIRLLRSSKPRLHHSISWKHTVPKILSEQYKKRSIKDGAS